MALNSSTVTAASDATADQYNNLRKDVLARAGEYAVSTGSANAQLLAVDAQIVAYETGQVFRFKAGYANTAALTLNVNSIGVKTIKNGAFDLIAGDVKADDIISVIYDGTNLQLLNTKTSKYSGFAGEAITVGDCLSIHHYPTTAQSTTIQWI